MLRLKRAFVRVIVFALIAVSLAAVTAAPAHASQVEAFIVTGDDIIPLAEATLPAFFGPTLYLADVIFKELGVDTYYNRTDKVFIMEYGRRSLTFTMSTGFAVDEKGTYYDEKAEIIGSYVFVPVNFVCNQFGLTFTTIVFDPLTIVRLKNGREKLDDQTFLTRNASLLRQIYAAYRESQKPPAPTSTPTPVRTPPPTAPATAGPTARPTATPTLTPTPTPVPTYETVTLYFSFYDVGAAWARRVMTLLEQSGLRGLFYVTEKNITDDSALIREITGRGHVLGLMLETGTYSEYLSAKEALFEAAAVRTPIITGIGDDAAAQCRRLASQYKLIFRANAREFICERNSDDLQFPTAYGTRAELRSSGINSIYLQDTLRAAEERKYNIASFSETTEASYDPFR